jgi:peptidoglycan/xylan/chitin deacetylase (PgdA/CDA1 family)
MSLVRSLPRRVGAQLYYGSLRTLGITAMRRRCQDASVILCYHNVVASDDEPAGAPGLHMRLFRFEQQIRWLIDHYDVVSLREFVAMRSERTSRPLAAVTFDDGYAGVFEHAVPFLEHHRVPATVFVVADVPTCGFWWDQPDVIGMLTPPIRDGWLQRLRGDAAAILSEVSASGTEMLPAAYQPADWSTIREHVSSRIEIGVHSATHRCLPTLTDAELEHEIVTSRTLIHAETGVWPEFFAYPYGLSNGRVGAAVRNAGYRGAVGLEGRVNGSVDRWALPRMPVPSEISATAFEAWMAGFH